MNIDSLPELIKVLKGDHEGEYAVLHLTTEEIESIADYSMSIDDFADVYVDFLGAIRACTTVSGVELDPHLSEEDVRRAFPILNPLCKQWPDADPERKFSTLPDEGPSPFMGFDTLHALIERLRDTDGDSVITLEEFEFAAIVAYSDIDSFAEIYCEFLDAVKANTTIEELRLGPHFDEDMGDRAFPILNPLCMHLPKARVVHTCIRDDGVKERVLHDIDRFKVVHIYDEIENDDHPAVYLNPELELFQYECRGDFSPVNDVIGPIIVNFPDFPDSPKLYELTLGKARKGGTWHPYAGLFTAQQLSRLASVVHTPSLMKLSLNQLRFSSVDQCIEFGQGLVLSPVQELRVDIFTPEAENFRAIVDAIARMPNLQLLEACFYLDLWRQIESPSSEDFSIPLGDMVRQATGLRSLTVRQDWKPCDTSQCKDLAVALQAPSYRLQYLDVETLEMTGLAIVMQALSSPTSTIKTLRVSMAPFVTTDVDAWLPLLPKTTGLQSLTLNIEATGSSPHPLTKSQGLKLVEILSGWLRLKRCAGSFFAPEHLNKKPCGLQLATVLVLNRAGRHYLTSPTPSQADGVEVLAKASKYLNAVYFHLRENPLLCDRRASSLSK